MQMRTKHTALTRMLPKTGQVSSQRTGDDAYFQKGWWRGKTVENNLVRLIAQSIGGDDVVIDRATGLMWAADFAEAGCNNQDVINWNGAIDYALALDFAGFTDWRIPNAKEVHSIVDYGMDTPAFDTDFFIGFSDEILWTSTHQDVIGYPAFVLNTKYGMLTVRTISEERQVICVRGGS